MVFKKKQGPDQMSINYSLLAKPICLYDVYGCVCCIMAELSRCDEHYMTLNVKNIY